MNTSGDDSGRKEIIKAKILNRIIAKGIDFIIIAALIEVIPKAGYFAGLAYLLIGDGLFEGKSVGKWLIKIKVFQYESGKPCAFRESVIRNFPLVVGYILMKVPLIGFIFPLLVIFFEGLLMIGNERYMRFGDELAKTRVIEENPATADNESKETEDIINKEN